MARLLRDALESHGFDVRTAASALEARAALEEFDPDVALVDLVLGGGPSGVDLAHLIHRTHPGVGILVLTRYPDLRSAGYADAVLPPGAGFVRKDLIEDSRHIVDGQRCDRCVLTRPQVRCCRTQSARAVTSTEPAATAMVRLTASSSGMSRRWPLISRVSTRASQPRRLLPSTSG